MGAAAHLDAVAHRAGAEVAEMDGTAFVADNTVEGEKDEGEQEDDDGDVRGVDKGAGGRAHGRGGAR